MWSKNVASSYANKIETIRWTPTSHVPVIADDNSTSSLYTHVVRFGMIPLLLAAGDALLSVESSGKISWQDIQETIKLLLSWHCQLSNLADAEIIPLLSISMEELETDQYEQEDILNSFLSPDTEEKPPEDGMHIDEDKLSENLREIIDQIKYMLKRVNKNILKTDNKKGLVSLTKQIIHKHQCKTSHKQLWRPSSSHLALRVYTFLKPSKTPTRDDIAYCWKDGSISNQPACKNLDRAFPPRETKEGNPFAETA
jgi:hypothetical protein